jgi:ferredoxin
MSTPKQEILGTAQGLEVDVDRCAGHGRCFSMEPDLFDSDDAGYAVVRHEVVPAELLANAENAVANCPEAAISLRTAG